MRARRVPACSDGGIGRGRCLWGGGWCRCLGGLRRLLRGRGCPAGAAPTHPGDDPHGDQQGRDDQQGVAEPAPELRQAVEERLPPRLLRLRIDRVLGVIGAHQCQADLGHGRLVGQVALLGLQGVDLTGFMPVIKMASSSSGLEDTDNLRSTEDSAAGILDGLRWLGLDWDEGPDIGGPYGPYRQSERLSIYQEYLQQLLDEGKAYYCFCTAAELHEQAGKSPAGKKNYLYDGSCLNLSPEQIAANLEQGLNPVIRLKVPRQGQTVVDDLIRGEVAFDNSLLDDFIIAKSDGWPTYNFAVVIDDYTMKISHVIRAEEHLSNTPKQLQVYQALGLTPPQFAHVSMILAPDRSKLSKRHGATSVQEFRDEGYLPEALVNYLALLGWSPGENIDIFPWEEMPQRFSLDDVSRSAAIYDLKKLAWMNGHYISVASIDRIVKLLEPEARQKGWLHADNIDYFNKVIDLVRSRAQDSQ